MVVLVKLIGIIIMILGFAIFASPAFSRKMFDFFKEDKRIYYAGVIRVAIGLILLVATSRSVVPLAAIAVGMMFLISGIVIFAADVEKMKTFIVHYSEMPGLVIRLLGLVAASFGILMFSIF